MLTSAKPEYAGITVVEMRLSDAATKRPEALARTGEGNLFALSDNKYIGGHGGDPIMFACAMRVPEDWVTVSGIDWGNPPMAREALLQEFSDWAPALTDLIRDCDDTIWPRPIYALPTGHTWDRVPGVTLLGDAAHLMSPFAGEGANMAMIDGADLAREILGRTDVNEAIAAYEQKMFRRGAKAAGSSAKSLNLMFADGPAPHAGRAIPRHVPDAEGDPPVRAHVRKAGGVMTAATVAGLSKSTIARPNSALTITTATASPACSPRSTSLTAQSRRGRRHRVSTPPVHLVGVCDRIRLGMKMPLGAGHPRPVPPSGAAVAGQG